MRKKFLEWLIGWLLPGFHLHQNPIKQKPADKYPTSER